MPPSMFELSAKPLCSRYLSFAEREEIALLRVQGYSMQGGRSPARGEWHRQSPESCGATPPTRKRQPRVSCDDDNNGTPSARHSPPKAEEGEACAQRGVKNLCRGTVGLASLWLRAGLLFQARSCPGKAVGTDHGRTGDGQTPGARSRSPVACRWTSRTTRPCASAMKPSIKRCSFKVEARCAAN